MARLPGEASDAGPRTAIIPRTANFNLDPSLSLSLGGSDRRQDLEKDGTPPPSWRPSTKSFPIGKDSIRNCPYKLHVNSSWCPSSNIEYNDGIVQPSLPD